MILQSSFSPASFIEKHLTWNGTWFGQSLTEILAGAIEVVTT
jgi:tellurite resistance-related uncharacterized protein